MKSAQNDLAHFYDKLKNEEEKERLEVFHDHRYSKDLQNHMFEEELANVENFEDIFEVKHEPIEDPNSLVQNIDESTLIDFNNQDYPLIGSDQVDIKKEPTEEINIEGQNQAPQPSGFYFVI